MDIQGTITSGNYSRQLLNMTGNVHIKGGNFIFARITTNGFALTIAGGNTRGIYLDGEKQDEFELPTFAPLALGVAIMEEFERAGKDGWDAWRATIQIVHAQNERITVEQFKSLYATSFTGMTYSGAVLDAVTRATGISGWDNIQDLIANHTEAQLTGEPTELVEVER